MHDIGKIFEFDLSPLGVVKEYSVRGHLLGHLVMGAMMVRDKCRELCIDDETSVLLQHMLVSHHGELQFGAAVVPQTVEAELLHWIDMIDARMEVYREQLEEIPVGEFSPKKIFGLDKPIYHHA